MTALVNYLLYRLAISCVLEQALGGPVRSLHQITNTLHVDHQHLYDEVRTNKNHKPSCLYHARNPRGCSSPLRAVHVQHSMVSLRSCAFSHHAVIFC